MFITLFLAFLFYACFNFQITLCKISVFDISASFFLSIFHIITLSDFAAVIL